MKIYPINSINKRVEVSLTEVYWTPITVTNNNISFTRPVSILSIITCQFLLFRTEKTHGSRHFLFSVPVKKSIRGKNDINFYFVEYLKCIPYFTTIAKKIYKMNFNRTYPKVS